MSMLQSLLEPKRRQKAAEEQEQLRNLMGHRVARHSAQADHLYGMARERLILDRLANLSETVTDNGVTQLYEQLAESLALQGKFQEAAAVAPEGPYQESYKVRVAALEHIGEQMCRDPATRDDGRGKQEATQLKSKTVWNGKTTITFTQCIICSAISAYA